MKKILLILVFCVSGCSSINKLYNDFNQFKEDNDDVGDSTIRIYFDRWGAIYPDVFIEHATFAKNFSTLETVYLNEWSILNNALKSEDIQTKGYDTKQKIRVLEEALVLKYSNKINRESKNKNVLFFIHGYNNTACEASPNYEKLKREILKNYDKDLIQLVEVYWDGLHDAGIDVNSAKIWDNAQVSAAYVGLGLRRVLSKMNQKSYVITHSHGAAVITESLFNVRRFDSNYYHNHKDGKEIVSMQNDYSIYATPTSDFVVGMLAPAIPGWNVFKNYHHRTTADGNVVTIATNYKFVSGFNVNDQATTKLGLSSKFGSTTLGCEKKENDFVSARFSTSPGVFVMEDFSLSNNLPQKEHGLKAYISNENFPNFLEKILKF